MLRLTLWTLFLATSFISTSHAGFEWLPPQDNPVKQGMDDFDIAIEPPTVADKMITPIYQAPQPTTPGQPEPIMNSYMTPSPSFQSDSFMKHKTVRPPSPSLASGNTASRSTYSTGGMASARSSYYNQQTRPSLANSNSGAVSLYIDPYPMGRESTNSASREMRAASVEQAMMEISQQVHPMQMGQNLHTGAQMAYAEKPTVIAPTDNPISGMAPRTLTPVGTMGSIQSGPVEPIQIRNYAKVEGFGSDLPLALALQQVIPDNFTHSFALGVDPGTTVSWQGGKAWNLVLEDMLRAQGLTALIKQNTVTIQPIMAL